MEVPSPLCSGKILQTLQSRTMQRLRLPTPFFLFLFFQQQYETTLQRYDPQDHLPTAPGTLGIHRNRPERKRFHGCPSHGGPVSTARLGRTSILRPMKIKSLNVVYMALRWSIFYHLPLATHWSGLGSAQIIFVNDV